MKLSELAGKKILIVGYGIEGKATHEYLQKRLPGAVIGIAETTDGPDYAAKQNEYDIAIKSPGVRRQLLAIPYTTATNIFFSEVKGKTVGVTGTKGKSTTSALIAHFLKAHGLPVKLVGNIGIPMLSVLDEGNDEQTIYVIELSSYQLMDIVYAPDVSVIINLYPEHMDYHGDVESYWQAKLRIIEQAQPDDVFIYNDDFPALVKAAKKAEMRTMSFASSLPFPAESIPLLGKHNVDNALAAVTVARYFGVSDAVMEQAITTFVGLPHRLEHVGTYNGIAFYDDAISTTPESTMYAIDAFENVGTIFLGGQDRGYNFEALVKKLEERQIQNIVLFPDSGEKIRSLIASSVTYRPTILATQSMEEAVVFAYEHTSHGAVCLLSCASPSYSLWKNFEEKGNEFKKFIALHKAE